VSKEAWGKVFGRRRRVLKKIDRSGSTGGVRGDEQFKGSLTGAVLGTVATAAAVGSVGLVAAPSALVGGAIAGAMVVGGRARRQADSIISSVKGNEENMREAFEDIIGSLATLYDDFKLSEIPW
jgi:hypothetical protein